jgi:hypothetical protein
VAGVSNEVAVDDVGQLSLQSTDGLFGGFAFGDFAVVVDAARCGSSTTDL